MRRYRPLTLVAALAALSLAAPGEVATAAPAPSTTVTAQVSHLGAAAQPARKRRVHKKRRVVRKKRRVVKKRTRVYAAKPAPRKPVPARPVAAPARPLPPIRIMPMGDSITDQGSELGFRGYLLKSLLAAHKHVDYVGSNWSYGYPLADANHEGHPGWRNDELAYIAHDTVASHVPDIVLLMSGSNDLEQGVDPLTAARRMTTLLNTIHYTRPSTRIVVLTLIPDAGASASDVAAYNQLLRTVTVPAQGRLHRPVTLIDVSSATHFWVDYKGDNIHPNDQGQRRLAAAIYPGLVRFVTR